MNYPTDKNNKMFNIDSVRKDERAAGVDINSFTTRHLRYIYAM